MGTAGTVAALTTLAFLIRRPLLKEEETQSMTANKSA
jgi:hypothetical protein